MTIMTILVCLAVIAIGAMLAEIGYASYDMITGTYHHEKQVTWAAVTGLASIGIGSAIVICMMLASAIANG